MRQDNGRVAFIAVSAKHPQKFLPYFMFSGLLVTGFGFWQATQSGVGFPFWRPSTWFLTWGLGLFIVLFVAVRAFGPLGSGILVLALLGAWTSTFASILAVGIYLIAASAFGSAISRDTRMTLQNMLLGIVLIGTTFGIAQSLTVHTLLLWGPIFAGGVVLQGVVFLRSSSLVKQTLLRVQAGKLFQRRQSFSESASWSALLSLAAIHALTAFMPEQGHDALATHLYVPLYVEANGHWRPDASLYVWSYMPTLFTWSASPLAVLGGETAVRYFSFSLVLLLATLTFNVTRWVGLAQSRALWGPIAFLSTPLVYLMSATIFSDSLLALLLWSGTLQLLRLHSATRPLQSALTAGVLLGGAVSTKAQALPILALVIVFCIIYLVLSHRFAENLWALTVLGFTTAAFGGIAYLRAYFATGNPVFPFYNNVFKSQYFPQERFANHAGEFVWNTPYRMTFESWQYLEGSLGSPGFSWLIVVVPVGILGLFSFAHRRISLVVAALAINFVSIFPFTAYLRYVLPAVLAAAVLVPVSLDMADSRRRSHLVHVAVAGLLLLNLVHLDSATWYGRHDLTVLRQRDAASAYLAAKAPVRAAIESVNTIAGANEYVAMVGSSLPAGLNGRPLMASWYNFEFQHDVASVETDSDAQKIIADRNVSAVIGNVNLESTFLESVSRLCRQHSDHGPMSVWNCTGVEAPAIAPLSDH